MLFVAAPQSGGKSMLIDIATGVLHRSYKSTPSHYPQAAAFSAALGAIVQAQEQAAVYSFASSMSQPQCKSIVGEVLSALSVSPCGGWLLAGGVSGCVYVWNLVTGELLSILKGHQREVTSVCFDSDGSSIASTSADTTCRVYHSSAAVGVSSSVRPRCVLTYHSLPVHHVAFFHHSSFLATVSEDRTCRIACSQSGTAIRTVRVESPLWCVAVHPSDTSLVLGGDDGCLYACDIYRDSAEDREPTKMHSKADGHTSRIVHLSFSSSTAQLLSCSSDGVVLSWNDGQVVGELLRTNSKLGCVTRCEGITEVPGTLRLTPLRKYPSTELDTVMIPTQRTAAPSATVASSAPRRHRKGKRDRPPQEAAATAVEEEPENADARRARLLKERLLAENAKLLNLANELFADVQALTPK
jgi:WD40 repeat protein